MGLGGLGLPCGACGCVKGCTDCGWTSGGYPVGEYVRANICCLPQCYPCEISLNVVAGNTWILASGLTTADRSAIASYLSGTWVLRHEPFGSQLNPNYQFQSSSWLASFTVGLNIDDPCYAFWPSFPYQGIYNNGSLIENVVWNSVSPAYTGSSLLSLSGGKYLLQANLSFVDSTSSGDAAPFSMSDWCGVNYWSTSIVTPTSTFPVSSQNMVRYYDPALGRPVTSYFTNHTVTISW